MLHDAKIGKNIGEIASLEADHFGRLADGCVIKPCCPARPHSPLRTECFEQAERRPCVWPDLYHFLLNVILGQPQRRQLLGGRTLFVAGPRRRFQFPRRAGL